MNFLQAIILSIVEGISEFLPISSTGHLNLTRVLLNLPNTDFFSTFEIFIQLGAILAIVVLYFGTFSRNFEVWKRIIIAFIPTAIIGLILGKFIKHYLVSNEYVTIIALFIGGVALVLLELIYKEKDHHADKIEDINFKNAFLIGICQSIAVIPGVSRSAATIVGALFLGTKRKSAVEFSFLLAIPTMIAATAFDLKDANFSFTGTELILMAIGFIGSFITALIAVKWFVKYVQTHNFIPFGIYRIVAALLFYLIVVR
jgi:undecaprenyl-diphosphatase